MKLSTLALIPITAAFKYYGCVQDSPNRILESFVGFNIHINDCIAVCTALRYSFAGVEAGNECYCSRKLQYQPKILDSSACDMNCSTQILNSSLVKCGGDWAIDIWELQIQPRNILNKTRYIGCIQDTHDGSIDFSARFYKIQTNTPEMCASFCDADNHIFSAVENGSECFCADSLKVNGKNLNWSLTFLDESRCRVKCTGSDDYCGGSWAFALRVNSSYPAIDFNYPGSIPPSPNALSLFLSVLVISIASLCFLYSLYYIILKQEFLYKRITRTQRINNLIVYAFICNAIQCLITLADALPFTIRIYVGLTTNSYKSATIFVEDVRVISLVILLGLIRKPNLI